MSHMQGGQRVFFSHLGKQTSQHKEILDPPASCCYGSKRRLNHSTPFCVCRDENWLWNSMGKKQLQLTGTIAVEKQQVEEGATLLLKFPLPVAILPQGSRCKFILKKICLEFLGEILWEWELWNISIRWGKGYEHYFLIASCL